MARFLVISMVLLLSTPVTSQVLKSVTVEAGGLSGALTEEEKISVTDLSIAGTIDFRDFVTMRDSLPQLAHLDLGNVTLEANVVPLEAFCNPGMNSENKVLKSVILPHSTEGIGSYAFCGCINLESINFPENLRGVSSMAFVGCRKLSKAVFPGKLTFIGSSAFEGAGIVNLVLPSTVRVVESCAFMECDTLVSIKVESSSTRLGDAVFAMNERLRTVSLPEGIDRIGSNWFLMCSNLEQVNIPYSVTTIEGGAFNHCTFLPSVKIPPCVTQIGDGAFDGCHFLNEITVLNEQPPVIEYFSYPPFLNYEANLYVPAGAIDAYKSADYWKEFVNINETQDFWISADSVTLISDGTLSADLKVFSTGDLTLLCSQSWLNIQRETTSCKVEVLRLTADPNLTGVERTAEIKISGAGIKTIIVSQPPYPYKTASLSFSEGWNIMSARLMPKEPAIDRFLGSLVEDSALVKVQDESGRSFEDFGKYGGWLNHIGAVEPSEGYRVKVLRDCSTTYEGLPVDLPFDIQLQKGWNIMGFPGIGDADGLLIVGSLIEQGILLKVQDEMGNAIEDWGDHGGWINNFGNMIPGRGYKLKVSADGILTINNTMSINGGLVSLANVAPALYRTVQQGNGVDHMNVNLVEIPAGLLNPGDEIGVFDDNMCVGGIQITSKSAQNRILSVAVSAFDGEGQPGFREGFPISLRLWKPKIEKEFILSPEIIRGSSLFVKHESTFASLENQTLTGLEEFLPVQKPNLRVYPNPTTGKVTIIAPSSLRNGMVVEVLNSAGQVVLSKSFEAHVGEIDLSGHGKGIFIVKIVHNSNTITEKLLLR